VIIYRGIGAKFNLNLYQLLFSYTEMSQSFYIDTFYYQMTTEKTSDQDQKAKEK
jgi:hypothetical protein